jgi:hypothetical protein
LTARNGDPAPASLGESRRHLRNCGVRPDIIVERVSGLCLFSGETDRGREWLARQSESGRYERIGKSIAVEIERVARDLADAAIADGLDVME